jgi:hypothetical protein
MATLEDPVTDELEHPSSDVDAHHPEQEGLLLHAREGQLPAGRRDGHDYQHAQLRRAESTAKRTLMVK